MRVALAFGTFAFSVATTACVVNVDSQALIERDEKRFAVNGTPELNLATFDGAIEIRSANESGVVVDIEKRGATREAIDGLIVNVTQEGDRITVHVKRPKSETLTGFGFRPSASAKLIVSVPERANIVARSGDGAIKVERVAGRLELSTGDGSIRASDVGGDIRLNTGDGSIHVSGAEGELEVGTGDGSIEVAGSVTALKLHTGDGAIVYRADNRTIMSDDWEITTGDGSVTVYLPEGFSADLDARTSDGGIRNELQVGALNAEAEEGTARQQDENSRRVVR